MTSYAGTVVFGVGGLVALVVWFLAMRQRRIIEDTPTKKVAGVSLGLTELSGVAESDGAVVSPYGNRECVWYRVTLEEVKRSGNKTTRRRRVLSTGGPAFFDLVDDTGSMRVWPRKADVNGVRSYKGPDLRGMGEIGSLGGIVSLASMGATLKTGSQNTIYEEVIPTHEQIYVLGNAELGVDAKELEIRKDPAGSLPFLVRMGCPDHASRGEQVVAWIAAVVALLAAGAAGYAYAAEQVPVGSSESVYLGTPVAGVGFMALLFAIVSAVFVYNGLVRIRESATAAWGLIDIELRRRHDLIPQLSAIVSANRDHEAALQESLAALRSKLAHDLPANPTDEAAARANGELLQESSAVREFLAVAEAHPALQTMTSFTNLQAELERTEERLALARTFYNKSVRVVHDRATVVPGLIVAKLFDLDLSVEFHTPALDQDISDSTVPNVADQH